MILSCPVRNFRESNNIQWPHTAHSALTAAVMSSKCSCSGAGAAAPGTGPASVSRTGKGLTRSESARPHTGLRNADDRTLCVEAAQQLVGDRGGERLEQVVSVCVRELLHGTRDRAVVDRVLETIGRAALADLEIDVEQEVLAVALLVLVHAVPPEDPQAAQLDRDHAVPATARATASASMCSRTSWTRRIVAPRS